MTTRDALRARGTALRDELFGAGEAALANPGAGFADLMAELVYGSLWTRPGLGQAERMACTLSALLAVQNWQQLRRHIGAALNCGLDARAIVEVLLQDGIYRGFAASETALQVAQEVFAERGATLADEPRTDPLDLMMEKGRAVQAALHAERKDAAHASPSNPITSAVYPLIVQYCYGEIWGRPGLERRVRALCGVAAFAALDHEPLLRKFALSALNVGARRTEVVEAVIQIGPYCGFAFTLKGLTAISEEFAKLPAESA
jgi:4-carboxymuconolactone decarboxylase